MRIVLALFAVLPIVGCQMPPGQDQAASVAPPAAEIKSSTYKIGWRGASQILVQLSQSNLQQSPGATYGQVVSNQYTLNQLLSAGGAFSDAYQSTIHVATSGGCTKNGSSLPINDKLSITYVSSYTLPGNNTKVYYLTRVYTNKLTNLYILILENKVEVGCEPGP